MPTTVGGVAVFIAFLVPGFLAYSRRRKLSPSTKSASPLVETATIFTTSLVVNMVAVGLFALVRLHWPEQTPDLSPVIFNFDTYAPERMGWLLGWGAAILAVACLFAFILSTRPVVEFLGRVGAAPLIFDESAWYRLLNREVEGCTPYVGAVLKSGIYVGGYVYWFSTDVEESPDRDLVLSGPLDVVHPAETTAPLADFDFLILSWREIENLFVTWVPTPPSPP